MNTEHQTQNSNRNVDTNLRTTSSRNVMEHLADLRLPYGTAREWGQRAGHHAGTLGAVGVMAAIGSAAYKLAEEAEKENREATKKQEAEATKKREQEEWARTNGVTRPEYAVTQERGKHGEMKAEQQVAQNQARERRLQEARRPGASPNERRYLAENDTLGARDPDDKLS